MGSEGLELRSLDSYLGPKERAKFRTLESYTYPVVQAEGRWSVSSLGQPKAPRTGGSHLLQGLAETLSPRNMGWYKDPVVYSGKCLLCAGGSGCVPGTPVNERAYTQPRGSARFIGNTLI